MDKDLKAQIEKERKRIGMKQGEYVRWKLAMKIEKKLDELEELHKKINS